MKYQRARRSVGSRSDPLAFRPTDGGASAGAALAHNGGTAPGAPPSPQATPARSHIPMAGWGPARREPMRKLTAPQFVERRQNGGVFRTDPLAPIFMQPKDYLRLKQKAMVRWRLNRWAQDLLEYTQAQRAAKTRASNLIEVSASNLVAPTAKTLQLDSKAAAVPFLERQSVVLGISLNDKPTNTLKITE